MPAHRVQRIVRVGGDGDLATLLDLHRELALLRLVRAEGLVHLRRVEHGRVVEGVTAQQALVRRAEVGVRRLDHQDRGRRARPQSPHGPARQVEIVAGRIDQAAIVAEQLALALMDEQQLVAVGVAGQRRHGRRQLPEADLDGGVVQHHGRAPRRGLRLVQPRQVEGAGPQGTLELHPAGGRALVVQEGGGTEEALLGDLPLIGALGHVGVGLAGMGALGAAHRDPVSSHQGSSL